MVEIFKYIHLSTGDLLREEVKKGTETGIYIESLISKGNLVPSEISVSLIKKAILEKG